MFNATESFVEYFLPNGESIEDTKVKCTTGFTFVTSAFWDQSHPPFTVDT